MRLVLEQEQDTKYENLSPCSLLREPDTSLTQLSQVRGTAKVA